MSDACCGHDHGHRPVLGAEPERLRDVREIRLAAVAGVGLAVGLLAAVLGEAGEEGVAARVAFAGALVAGGLTFIPDAVRGLVRRRLSVATLMAIAAVGAVILGEWGEAATLAFLFSISEALESYALTRTRRGLRALLDLVPATATILRGGAQVTVPPDELRRGDVLLVRPGERIATDGVIRRGRSALDVSAITGESVPVERGPGEEVFAASINGGGVLEVAVTARTQDNSLARIVRVVEEAQERKGHSQRLAERIARPLVPGVLVAALGIAVVGSLLGDPATWIERSLVVLVAAAPCAFAISVPVTVVAAIGAATRSGVLIKGGAALEALGRVRAVALDKTGTLTRNDPRVVDVATTGAVSADEVLSLATALEERSEHPLARAIVGTGRNGRHADDVEAVPGSGLVGRVDGALVRLGRPGFIAAGSLEAAVERLQGDGATVVLLEHDGELLGAVAVRDELRPEAEPAVAALRARKLGVTMLTGDNRRTADALAARAGIADVHAGLLPTDKAAAVQKLQQTHPVAMVGDGINDAPALATADVGIAMGAMGTDAAIEAADVALMGDDLRHLPDTLRHARAATRIMVQNLLLSGAILVTLIPLAASGVLGLAAVVAVHELAEVVVIANGVRAGRRAAFGRHEPLDAPAPAVASESPAVPVAAVLAPLPLALATPRVPARRGDADDAGCLEDCCR